MDNTANLQNQIDQILVTPNNQNTEQETNPQKLVSQNGVVPMQNIQSSQDAKFQQNQKIRKQSSPIFWILLIGIIAGVAVLISFVFTGKFGVFTYRQCLKQENSTIVELSPAYCATAKGKVFFKNRNERIPTNVEVVTPEFDLNNPPETILPESL